MQNNRRNLTRTLFATTLAVAASAWLLVAFAAAQEPHAHDEPGAHTRAAGAADHQAEAGHGAEGDHGGHGPTGLADDLPFWGIVAFIGFILVVKKLGWGALTSEMASREAEELRLISEAEGLRRQAAEQLTTQRGQMEALDEHVRAALAEADRDAAHTRNDIRAAADREAANARARVDLEISRVKDQTLNDLFENFTQRVIDSTQEQLRGRLDPAAQDRLMDAALEEFAAGQVK